MALRNTSERYEYIYGSNVRKLETDTAGKQTAKAVPAKKNVRRPEQSSRFRSSGSYSEECGEVSCI